MLHGRAVCRKMLPRIARGHTQKKKQKHKENSSSNINVFNHWVNKHVGVSECVIQLKNKQGKILVRTKHTV